MKRYAVTTQDRLDDVGIDKHELSALMDMPVYITSIPFSDEVNEKGELTFCYIIDPPVVEIPRMKVPEFCMLPPRLFGSPFVVTGGTVS